MNEIETIEVTDELVLPVNNTLDLEAMQLCEDCKNKLIAEFIKQYRQYDNTTKHFTQH